MKKMISIKYALSLVIILIPILLKMIYKNI